MSIAPFLPALPPPAAPAIPATPAKDPGAAEAGSGGAGGASGTDGAPVPFDDALAAALALLAPPAAPAPAPVPVESSPLGVETSPSGAEASVAGVQASLVGIEGSIDLLTARSGLIGTASGHLPLAATAPATASQPSGATDADGVLPHAEGTATPSATPVVHPASGAQGGGANGFTPGDDAPAPAAASSTTTTDASTPTTDASTPATDASTPTTGVSTPASGASTIKPDVVSKAVVQQVFPEVTRVVTAAAQGPNGTQRITLTLQPEQLGEVRVTLVVRDGSVQVRLAGDAGDGRIHQSLAQGAPELQRLLERTGADARVVVRDPFLPPAPTAATPGAGAPSTAANGGSWQQGAGQEGLGGWDAPGEGHPSGREQHDQHGRPGRTGEPQAAPTSPVAGTTNRSGRLDRAL